MLVEKTVTPKQLKASMLRRKEYRDCSAQVSFYGCNEASIEIFRGETLVAVYGYKCTEWGWGKLLTGNYREATPEEESCYEAFIDALRHEALMM